MTNTREKIIKWIDQFENDHYEFDMYGEKVKVDLPREIVEKILDISILLVDRVVDAKGILHTSEYEKLEKKFKKENPDTWLIRTVLEVVPDDHLFGRYRDIANMIGKLRPHNFPLRSATYLTMILPEIYELIYAAARCVDEAQESYTSLVYTFFLGVLGLCWGEGFGWRKENGNWVFKGAYRR